MGSVQGQAGCLKAAGRIAAQFASWAGQANPHKGCNVKAFVSERNDFRLDHSPELTLELAFPGAKGMWRWRNPQVIKDGIALQIIAEGEGERG